MRRSRPTTSGGVIRIPHTAVQAPDQQARAELLTANHRPPLRPRRRVMQNSALDLFPVGDSGASVDALLIGLVETRL